MNNRCRDDLGSLSNIRPSESGQVAGVETLAIGLLIFMVGSLLILNAWAVVDARLMVATAAREATRAAVESPNADVAQQRATQQARTSAAGHGQNPDRLRLSASSLDESGFRRCGPVSVTVSYDVPMLVMPWVGGLGHGFTVHATHESIVDPYRDSDLDGSCA